MAIKAMKTNSKSPWPPPGFVKTPLDERIVGWIADMSLAPISPALPPTNKRYLSIPPVQQWSELKTSILRVRQSASILRKALRPMFWLYLELKCCSRVATIYCSTLLLRAVLLPAASALSLLRAKSGSSQQANGKSAEASTCENGRFK